MQRFDCLAKECPLWGPHLLEAAAGTGKTFAIEHIVVRLILAGVELEKILVVTFTRAATRELKQRIRANLQKALDALKTGETTWEYLQEYRDNTRSLSFLQSALEIFDHCQIFTIHGFCYRQLSEFAFDIGLGLTLPNPDESRKVPAALRAALEKFWEQGVEDLLCPEQLVKLMKKTGSLKELNQRLLKVDRAPESATPFPVLLQKFRAICSPVDEEKIQQEFALLSQNYKKKKGNFEAQVRALVRGDLRALIEEEGSIFEFLDPANQKVKVTQITQSGFFEEAREKLFPLIQEAADPKKIFALVAIKWNETARRIALEENYFQPDELLQKMRQAAQNPALCEKLGKKYEAVIIDEFQDTDLLQWEIFRKLFTSASLRALYLVGDPKQSIYRFRGADVYTYFAARDFLGTAHLYHLDTNFRSTPALIDATNALFQRKWLPLPKLQAHVPYFPVRAGLQVLSPLADGKGAVHWIRSVKPLYMWEYVVQEIEKLQQTFPKWSSFALLVKDRYQAEQALALFQKRGIPGCARSHTLLGETEPFRRVKELLKKRHVGDLVAFARQSEEPVEKAIWEKLFAWEQREGFSVSGLERFLEELGEEERVVEADADAVQVLTIHVSKGLEFDVVFAWGLAFSSPEGGEELDAEKLRQLYVAMTRAKYRLYVPFPVDSASPMALFLEGLSADATQMPHATVEELVEPITLAPVVVSASTPPAVPETTYVVPPCYLQSFTSLGKAGFERNRSTEEEWNFSPSTLGEKFHSSSDAALPQKPAIPLGTEVGVVFHQIFEKLFKKGCWRQSEDILRVVQEELRFSSLLPHAEEIYTLIDKTLALQLPPGFSLKQVVEVYPEMEFLFQQGPHFVKGFIDLVFCVDGVYYLADWKTNWVGEKSLEQIMDEHDYWLQAKLYKEALQRYVKGAPFGGAFYFFVREGTFLCWNDT